MKHFVAPVFALASTLAYAAGEPPLVVKSGQTQQLPAADTLQLRNVTGSTQCIHADSSGNLSGTGSDCGSGGASGANPTATAGDVAVNGSASTFLRSDGAPAVQKGSASQFGIVKVDNSTITASGGIISLPSITDGRVVSNISGGSAAPAANTVSALLDHALGSTRGDILYRDASGWQVLAPGLGGSFLQTGGSAANPVWAVASTVFGSYQYIFVQTGTFTHSFACSGNLLTPQRNITVYSIGAGLTTVTSGTYRIGIAPYDTVNNKITSAPVYTSLFTETSGIANAWVLGNFGSGYAMTGGTNYIEFICRTDAGTTPSTTLQTASALPSNTPGIISLGVSSTARSFHLASTAPTTSDVWTTETGWYEINFNFGF